MKICEIDGCEKKYLAQGLCRMHYSRKRRNGDPNISTTRSIRVCNIEGCEKKHLGHGLCSTHFYRKRRNGDPNTQLNASPGSGTINTAGYRRIGIKGHPLATKGGSVFEHRVVLYAAIGEGEHACHWCGTSVQWMKQARVNAPKYLTVDHLNHNRLDNRPENLVPSCSDCNRTRTIRTEQEE